MNFVPPIISLFVIALSTFVLYSTFLDGNGLFKFQMPNLLNTRYLFTSEKINDRLDVENKQTLIAFFLFYIVAVLLFFKGMYDGILTYHGYSRYSDRAVSEIAQKAFRQQWF